MMTFIIASLIVMGKSGNFLFAVCIIEEGYDSPMPLWPRRFVALAILSLEAFQLVIFYKIALKEFNSKANDSGDLIVSRKLNAKDRYAPFWALVIFHVLEIDILVRDVVKYCHPFKDKQPYAAFKADGHRAFLFGFRDVHSYYASHMPRPFSTLLAQILMEAICLVFKVFSAIKIMNVAYGLMSLPGLFIIFLKTRDVFKRLRHRERYWTQLYAAHHYGDDDDKRRSQNSKEQLFPNMSWDKPDLDEQPRVRLAMVALILAVAIIACGLWFIHDTNKKHNGLNAVATVR